jgi:hypothetical protein
MLLLLVLRREAENITFLPAPWNMVIKFSTGFSVGIFLLKLKLEKV